MNKSNFTSQSAKYPNIAEHKATGEECAYGIERKPSGERDYVVIQPSVGTIQHFDQQDFLHYFSKVFKNELIEEA